MPVLESLSRRRTLGQRFLLIMCAATLAASLSAQDHPDATAETLSTPMIVETVAVPGGSFPMGSSFGVNEAPQHKVSVQAFHISRSEITRAQYGRVMGSTPPQPEASDDMPVSQISWYDAVRFCNALSALENLKPAYAIKGTAVALDPSATGYRLPTEAEWEFAARGGETDAAYNFSGSNKGNDVSWFDENSGRIPHAVGQKAPNQLGLVDMSGNVSEWCGDWYQAYAEKSLADPTGPAKGKFKVIRGGSCVQNENSGRVSFRMAKAPKSAAKDLGFRIVRR